MPESLARTALLRRIRQIAAPAVAQAAKTVALGHRAIDDAIGGGLARARLHEVFAIDAADAASAAGFAAMLARRLGGTLVWLRADGAGAAIHAPGLGEIGLDAAGVIVAHARDPAAVLRAGLDVVRCPQVGVAVIELARMPAMLDLTATRRLAVAAETSGVTPILLRIDAQPAPSAAQTRWAVAAAPSAPLDAGAPGHPALRLELLRQRGSPAGFEWIVEWDREQAVFRDIASTIDGDRDAGRPAESGAVVSLAARRAAGAAGAGWRRAG